MTDGITLAEGGGFEPPEAFTSHAFEACALVRSATLPPASVTEAAEGPGRAALGTAWRPTRPAAATDSDSGTGTA